MRFIFFWIFILATSCTHRVVKTTNTENTTVLSVDKLFLLLPDEAFPINEVYPTLSKIERQAILKSTTYERATALYSNFKLANNYGRNDGFLAFHFVASDDGILVQLKTWQRKDQSVMVGVNVSYGDHCCDYSHFKLYHFKRARFKEVTDKVFPKLTIEDFVPNIDAATKALFPSELEYSIYVTAENEFLEVSIDHTPMFFDLEKDVDTRSIKLVWRNNRFLIDK